MFKSRVASAILLALTLLLAFAVPFAPGLAAQEISVRGRITDGVTGQSVAGADVVLLDRLGTVACSALSGEDGAFTLRCPSLTRARIRVSRIGYQGAERELALSAAGATGLEIILQPGVERLEPLVVTASREARALSSASAAVSVVDAASLVRSAATEPARTLQDVPGLYGARSSGGGFDFNARGFNSSSSRRMILLVDGRRASTSNVLGFITWDGLPFSALEVDRIEVLKGPGAALYGANAHSGLVQFITKDPADLRGTSADVGGGERSTFWADAVQGVRAGRVDVSVSAGYMEGDEWPLAVGTEFLARGQFVPYAEQVEAAGKRTRKRVNASAALDAAGGRLRISAGGTRRDGTWVTGSGRVEARGSEYRYAALRYDSPAWTLLANGNWNDSGDWTLLTNGQKFYEVSRDAGAEIHRRIRFGDSGQLLLGSDYRHIRADTKGVTFPGVRTQNLYGLFAQVESGLGSAVSATLAGRVDHHPQNGWQFSPKVGLVARPSAGQAFHVSYAEGYQNPSLVEYFIDLAIPLPDGSSILVKGNKDLDPERVRSFEVGYRGLFADRLRVSVDAFRQKLDGFISDLVPVLPDPVTLSYRQEGTATVKGVEASLSWFITPRVRLDQGYAYLNASGTDEPLNAPAHRWNGGIRYEDPSGLSLSGTVTHVQAFPWRAGQLRADIPDYTPVSAGMEFAPPAAAWKLVLSADNLFDDRHMEMAGGSLLGRQVTGRLILRF
ncbi:MAG: TonB-dependent receptor domain-containing protein [Gemmatimonadota bacterium]